MSHLSTLYQLAKTERRPFQGNGNDLQLALSQLNGSEGIYGYKTSNLDSQKKKLIFFCWLSFYFTLFEFLYQHQKYYISAALFLPK